MARFGSLGGDFGLGGMSFPTRPAAPNSQEVQWMPRADEWLTDWQARYDAEAAKARNPVNASGTLDDMQYARTSGAAMQPSGSLTQSGMYGFEGGASGAADTSGTGAAFTAPSQPSGSGRATLDAGYTPDFTALNAEREQMMPMLEQQTRLQKAYNNMAGGGLLNALVTPEYAQPGFGQVNGDFGQNKSAAQLGEEAGLDMSWLDGVFNPAQGGATGTYGTTRRNSGGFM